MARSAPEEPEAGTAGAAAAPGRDGAAASDAGDEPEPSTPSRDLPLPKRRTWPWLVVLGLLAAGGSWLCWHHLTAPLPLRVLVAVPLDGYWWQGSKGAARLADRLATELKRLGFDPIRGGDPDTTAVLEDAGSPLAAARKLRAAFVLTGELPPRTAALAASEPLSEVRVAGRLRLQHVGEQAAFLDVPLESFAAASNQDDAVEQVADSLATLSLDQAVPALLRHPEVAAIVEGSDAKLVDQLAPAKAFADARADKLAQAQAAYRRLAEARLQAEHASPKPVYVSDVDAEEHLVAVAPKGLLVSTAAVTPVLSSLSLALVRHEALETVAWRGLDGAPGAVLWQGYNCFSYPSLAANGAAVVMLEDLYGRARRLLVIDGGGQTREALTAAQLPERDRRRPAADPRAQPATEPSRPSDPLVSPDGKLVALLDRSCVGCPPALRVLDLAAAPARERYRLDAADYLAFDAYRWVSPTELAVVMQPSAAGRYRDAVTVGEDLGRELWIVAVATGEARRVLSSPPGWQPAELAVSADGRRLAIALFDANDLALVDRGARTARLYAVGGRARAPAFSPDGKRVAFELVTRQHSDIALVDLESAAVKRLTDNDSPDRLPQFSPDGKRVYFEARNSDPVFGSVRAVVRIAYAVVP